MHFEYNEFILEREPFYHHPPHVSTRWYCPEVVPPMELSFEMRSMLNSLAKQNTWLLSADITINERIKPLVKVTFEILLKIINKI